MFKLYKKFRKRDWILTAIIIGLTILQVYCTMTMVDYVQGLISSIGYLNYHNDPTSMPQLVQLLTISHAFKDGAVDWTVFSSWLANNENLLTGLTPQVIEALHGIPTASIGNIWFNGGMMILVATGTALCQIVIEVLASYITANFATDIRSEVNDKITNFSLAEINKFSTASLITRATNDIQQGVG